MENEFYEKFGLEIYSQSQKNMADKIIDEHFQDMEYLEAKGVVECLEGHLDKTVKVPTKTMKRTIFHLNEKQMKRLHQVSDEMGSKHVKCSYWTRLVDSLLNRRHSFFF